MLILLEFGLLEADWEDFESWPQDKNKLWRKKERLSLKKYFNVKNGKAIVNIYTFVGQQTLNFSNHE